VVRSCTIRTSPLSEGNRKASRTVENASAVKFALSEAEVKEISDVVDKHDVIGGRYFNAPAEVLNLWG
jgi:diketogulonate reductase-like aldo/keto reductase